MARFVRHPGTSVFVTGLVLFICLACASLVWRVIGVKADTLGPIVAFIALTLIGIGKVAWLLSLSVANPPEAGARR